MKAWVLRRSGLIDLIRWQSEKPADLEMGEWVEANVELVRPKRPYRFWFQKLGGSFEVIGRCGTTIEVHASARIEYETLNRAAQAIADAVWPPPEGGWAEDDDE